MGRIHKIAQMRVHAVFTFYVSSGSETLNLSAFQIQYGAPFQFRFQLAVFGARTRDVCVRVTRPFYF
jgi:hypothetical protein